MRGGFQSSLDHIFVGGDLLTGTVDIISAIAAGNAAAESIHCYCECLPIPRSEIPKSARPRLEKKSIAPPCRPAGERVHDFNEVCLGLDESSCLEQSERCLHCGTLVPSILIRRETPKRNIVPWDKHEALRLWAKRHPESGEELPDVIDDVEEVLNPSHPPVFFRGKLMLKARLAEERLLYTMDDE